MGVYEEKLAKRLEKYSPSKEEDKSQTQAKNSNSSSNYQTRLQTRLEKYKSNVTVDDNYINTFITDSRSYLDSMKTDYEGMNWSNSKSVYDQRKTSTYDLRSRSFNIQRYLNDNKDRIDEDTYTSLMSYLNDFDSAAHEGLSSFYKASNSYSKYDSQEAYDKAVAQYKDDQALLYLDLDAYQREIDTVKADKQAWLQKVTTDPNSINYFDQNVDSSIAYDNAIASMEARLRRAKQLQEKERFEGVADINSKYYDPEFKNYTGYVSTKKEGLIDKYGDITYEVVNGNSEAWDKVATMQAWGQIADNEVTNLRSYGHMTGKEVSIYNYYYANGGKEAAEKYLRSIQETLNARVAGKDFTALDDKPMLELLFGVSAGLDQFNSGITNLFNTEDDYIPVSSTQILSGMVREDLKDTDLKWYNAKTGQWENQKILGSSLGQGMYDLTTTLSNMAPSWALSAIVGTVNPVAGGYVMAGSVGASAAGNAYQEKLNLGYSKEEARAYGTLVGISEATLEKLLGGISKYGDNILTKTVLKNLDSVDNVFARFARSGAGQLFLNGLSEATEEGLQSFIEPYLWQAVSGEEASADWQEIFYSALLGFVMGDVAEGGRAIVGNAAANSQYRKYGRDVMGANGGMDAVLEFATAVASDSDPQMQKDLTKQIDKVSKVKESGKTGRSAAKNIGKLYSTAMTSVNAQNKADIVRSLERKGYSSNEASDIADALVAQASGRELTWEQEKTLKSVKVDDEVGYDNAVEYAIQHIINNENSTMSQRNQRAEDLRENIAVGTMVKAYTEKAFTPEGKYAVSSKGEATRLEIEEDAEGKAITKDTGETIEIKGVHKIRKVEVDGKSKIEMILKLSDGTTINAENVAYANKKDALIYEAIANLGENIDPDTANELIAAYDGGDAMVFSRAMAQAYTYGFYGIDRSELVGKHSLATELTEEQRDFAYYKGEKYRSVKDQNDKADAQEKMAESGKKPGEKGVYYRDKDGNAIDIGTYMREHGPGLKDTQKTGIEMMKKLSEILGVRFNVFESWVENGTSYYLNEDGVKTKGNPNGFYDTATGEIYIALDAGTEVSGGEIIHPGTLVFTVAHELTHFMRQWSPEHFTKIASIVFKHGGMKGNVSELIALKQKKKADKGKPIDYDTAMEEVVADGMEAILKDGKVVEFMAEVKQKDHVAWQKLKTWFKKLEKFLRKMVWAYRSHSAQTTEGKKVAEFAENLLLQIKQIFAEGAVASGENYQVAIGNVTINNQITMEEDVIDSSNTGITKETKTGIKMQERTEFEAQPKQVFRVSTKNGKAESKMLGTNKSVKELRDARFQENGFSKEEVKKINGFIKEMADNMAKYRLKYKFVGLQNIHDAKIILNPMTGKIVLSAMVNNSDYSVNFDFTKICKKRVALQEVLETLAREKGKVTDGKVTEVNLSPTNIKRINDILASYGVETACLCCFVESKRYNIQNYYQEKVVDVWNKLVNEVAPEAGYFNFADSDVDTSKIPDSEFADLEVQMKEWAGKTGKAKDVEQKMREFLADSPAARKRLRFADLVTANGRTNLHKLYPEIESLILSKLGQSAPKSVEAFTPYNGEIDLLEAKGDGDIIKYLYDIAGVRSQSFSDFMIAHVFDVLQKTASMSARKMPAHVYTKEIARAMLFGMTGEKHNLSVLHNVDPNVDSWNAGLSKDGEYNFSDYEAYKKGYSEFVQSIGWKDAVKLQNTEGYSKDCGIIGVGFSYNHMLKLHNDPEVRQVIGYHTSQMPVEVKPLTHLDKAADYTEVQNTKSFVGFAKPNYAIPDGVPSYATPPQDVIDKDSKTPKTTKVSDTFDIIGTFKKLSEGKTGDARTAAAKETLRQLLEYANDHGYVLRVAPGEAGKGNFNLYEDVQKTQNPYLTTDHYIEYCIERGMLPMFFEFSMNPNYYKDIFDFNVFDRKSYNPETGLHEDSDGRKAYAPQTAVHMLNEDGSLAFPENFFDIVDKQMSNYNSYMQDVDSKMPSIMDEVRSVTNSTSKMSDRDTVKFADRTLAEELTPAKYNALLNKKPIRTSKKDWAKVNEARMSQYSRMDESDIPDLDIFSLAEYGKLNEGYLYFVRNYGKDQFVVVGKKLIIPEKRTVIREEQITHGESDSRKKTYPNDGRDGSGRGADAGDSERSGNRGKLRENDTGAGKNEQTVQKGDTVYGTSDSRTGIKLSDRDDVPTFYSQMAKVVDGLKQEKHGASSVVSTLRNKGVKAEEIKWSGIEAWLEGKKSVTKAELQEFIAGSMLQIEEEILDNKDRPYTEDQKKRLGEYKAKQDEVTKRVADEWKKITGKDLPISIRNNAATESGVVNAIMDANKEHKDASFEGRLLRKLKKDLKEVVYKNDDFGFDYMRDAIYSIHRHRKDFIKHYEMSSNDKAVIVKYCNALNAYNELPNLMSDEDADRLRTIAREGDQHSRKIAEVMREHNKEQEKYTTR